MEAPTRKELDRLATELEALGAPPSVHGYHSAITGPDCTAIAAILRAYPLPVEDGDPRFAPQPNTAAPPIVVEKHRHRMDGSEEVSFYACGPIRSGVAEAMADARAFAVLPAVERERTELARVVEHAAQIMRDELPINKSYAPPGSAKLRPVEDVIMDLRRAAALLLQPAAPAAGVGKAEIVAMALSLIASTAEELPRATREECQFAVPDDRPYTLKHGAMEGWETALRQIVRRVEALPEAAPCNPRSLPLARGGRA